MLPRDGIVEVFAFEKIPPDQFSRKFVDITTKMHFMDAIYFDCRGTPSKLKYENFRRVAARVLSRRKITLKSNRDIVSSHLLRPSKINRDSSVDFNAPCETQSSGLPERRVKCKFLHSTWNALPLGDFSSLQTFLV